MSHRTPCKNPDSLNILLDLAKIPWENLIDHEAVILMDLDPNEDIPLENNEKRRLAIAYKVIQVLKENE